MAFTVENGTIVAGANSYVSVAEADTYHLDRANAVWAAATNAAKQAALIKGTDYIDAKYANRYKGQRTAPAQPLFWPRQYVLQYDESRYTGYAMTPVYIQSNVIPDCLKDAVCEAALRALSTDLAPDLDRGGAVQSVTVGPISQTFFQGAPASTKFQAIDNAMSTLIRSSGTLDLVRS